jgi:hypothetical protein
MGLEPYQPSRFWYSPSGMSPMLSVCQRGRGLDVARSGQLDVRVGPSMMVSLPHQNTVEGQKPNNATPPLEEWSGVRSIRFYLSQILFA